MIIRNLYILMMTRTQARYDEALRVLEETDVAFFQGYVLPRIVQRRSMYCNLYIPNVATFGERNTNFVEATHRAIKRAGLSGTVPLHRAIELSSKIVQHYVTERQILIKRQSIRFSHIPWRPELNVLMNLMVPRFVDLIQNNMINGLQFNIIPNGTDIQYKDGTRRYTVNTLNWSCDCVLHVEFLLPCAHLLHAFIAAGNDAGKFLLLSIKVCKLNFP